MTTLSLKPKYKVELAVVGKSHFYDVYLPGNSPVRFPGVTGFLDVIAKPALINWAKKEALACVETALLKRLYDLPSIDLTMTQKWIDDLLRDAKAKPEKIKDEAAELGTKAHAFIDLIIHGKQPDQVPDEIASPVYAFYQWWKNSGIELVMGDSKVASLVHKYGGSLDALGRRNGQLIILDWKTGTKIWPSAALQTAAYCHAFHSTYGLYVQEAIVVRFSKKLPITFEYKKVRDIEKSLNAFLSAKALKEHLAFEHFEE